MLDCYYKEYHAFSLDYFFVKYSLFKINFDRYLALLAEGERRFPVRFSYAWINILPRDGSPGVCLAGKEPNEFAGKQNIWPLRLVLLFLIKNVFSYYRISFFYLFCWSRGMVVCYRLDKLIFFWEIGDLRVRLYDIVCSYLKYEITKEWLFDFVDLCFAHRC